MGEKMSVDRVNKVFEITAAPTLVDGEAVLEFDIKTDLYSDAKEDWLADSALRIRKFPLSAVGGNPTVGSKSLGSTYFIDPDWKIKLYPANHRFLVNGNFYSTDGTSPFLLPASNSVLLEQEVSSLVDSTVNQLPEIEGMSFAGVVSVDLLSPYEGTAYPVGNMEYPVNNFQDAVLIAVNRGIQVISVRGNADLEDAADDLSGYIVEGQSPKLTTLTIDTTAFVEQTIFRFATLNGVLDKNSEITDCIVNGLNYVSGRVLHSGFTANPVTLGGGIQASILGCWSEVAGEATPELDLGGSGQSLVGRDYTGGMRFSNRAGTDPVSWDFNSGHAIIDSTCTGDPIILRGSFKLTVEAGATYPNIEGRIMMESKIPDIAAAVLNTDAECLE